MEIGWSTLYNLKFFYYSGGTHWQFWKHEDILTFNYYSRTSQTRPSHNRLLPISYDMTHLQYSVECALIIIRLFVNWYLNKHGTVQVLCLFTSLLFVFFPLFIHHYWMWGAFVVLSTWERLFFAPLESDILAFPTKDWKILL